MQEFLKTLATEWGIVSKAPIAFFTIAIAMFGLAYLAARWRFTAVVEHAKTAQEVLKERLHLKTEQAESYKERALKSDEKVTAIVDSSIPELRDRALDLVRQIREFERNNKLRSDSIMMVNREGMLMATTDEEREARWHRQTTAMVEASATAQAEYAQRFKVDSILLRDELRSRLPGYKPETRVDKFYEILGWPGMVADDLEKMAKLLK